MSANIEAQRKCCRLSVFVWPGMERCGQDGSQQCSDGSQQCSPSAADCPDCFLLSSGSLDFVLCDFFAAVRDAIRYTGGMKGGPSISMPILPNFRQIKV